MRAVRDVYQMNTLKAITNLTKSTEHCGYYLGKMWEVLEPPSVTYHIKRKLSLAIRIISDNSNLYSTYERESTLQN